MGPLFVCVYSNPYVLCVDFAVQQRHAQSAPTCLFPAPLLFLSGGFSGLNIYNIHRRIRSRYLSELRYWGWGRGGGQGFVNIPSLTHSHPAKGN